MPNIGPIKVSEPIMIYKTQYNSFLKVEKISTICQDSRKIGIKSVQFVRI